MKKIKLAEIVIVSIILFIGLSIFVNKVITSIQDNKRYEELQKEKENVDNELKKSIDIKLYPTKNNEIIAKVNNSNSVPVSVVIEVYFYDKSDILIDRGTCYALQIAPNHVVYEEVFLVPEKYDHYYYTYTTNTTFSNNYEFESIDIKTEKQEKELIIYLTNNSEEKIKNIKGVVLYFLNDEIVYFDSIYESKLEPGETAEEISYNPFRFDRSDYTTIPIEYDSYIIHINESYVDE
jgi:hypothetical protein